MLKVIDVDKRSPSAKNKIRKGDEILSINGIAINDIIDYIYASSNDELDIVCKRGGETFSVSISKDEDEELGLNFDENESLCTHTCRNKCLFCFVDQMPKGMRDTLYVKDDDYRLSFASGNYITLTNAEERDIERIINYHLSPIYISVHATDGKLREELLNNRFAGKLMDYLKRLYDAEITMHTQIVMCEGINDGEVLKKTLTDLYGFYPCLKTVAVVPVGLTKYREGLYPLKPISKENAARTIDICEEFNKTHKAEDGEFCYPSDEFFIKADRKVWGAEQYGEYDQIENGVGMVEKFCSEFEAAAVEKRKFSKKRTAFITGTSFAPILSKLMLSVDCNHDVIAVENRYFGSTVSVAGLLTAQDILFALGDKKYDRIFLPQNVLREFGDVFLDNMTLKEFKKQVKCEVVISENDGGKLYRLL